MAVVTQVTPIVALDYSNAEDALKMVDTLADSCDFYKVGSELFTSAGPGFIKELRDRGCKIFLDLKFHDIPNTVKKASAAAAELGASLLTVHASGGPAMVSAAVEGAGERCGVLAVTVLTSLDSDALSFAWNRTGVLDLEQEVVRLAGIAVQSNAFGVVCSGQEAAALKAQYGTSLKLLVPGIRLPGSSRDDQSRVVTPQLAAEAGASYIILGRTVTSSSNPRNAMKEVWSQI